MLAAVIWFLFAIVVGVFNVVAAVTLSAEQMRQKFIINECLVGKFFTNIFYAPAWALKGLRVFFLTIIA